MAKAKPKKEKATKQALTLDEVLERVERVKEKGGEIVTISGDIPYDVYVELLKRKILVHQHQVPDTAAYYYTITI